MRDVEGEGRCQKHPAEGSADESHDTDETEGDIGGLRMVACRESLTSKSKQKKTRVMKIGVLEEASRMTGKAPDPPKFRAAREEEFEELDRRVWVEADAQELGTRKDELPSV